MAKTKTDTHITDDTTEIAHTTYRGAEFSSDLFASWTTLYRRDGKFFLYLHGGGGIRAGFQGHLSRSEAIDWLCSERIAFYEGGLARDQAEAMLDA